MSTLSRTIYLLSLISLFTDMASEMLYPVMPMYLKHIGFSVALIGILEGVAEATAGMSKGYFGKMSDGMGRRAPFVQLGYGLSALSKPMMALFAYPLWIFLARTVDRLGKGLRTGARDAMLSDEAGAGMRGRVFGFHRAMDTLGAVLGPSLALLYLYYHPADYINLFYLAFVPGLLAVGATLLLRDKKTKPRETKAWQPFFAFTGYWKTATPQYRRLVGGLLVFTLFNSSDLFLLLKARESGLDDTMVIGTYIFYNLVYALAAFPLGIVADKVGLKKVFVVGLLLFAVVYAGFSFAQGLPAYIALFFVYGLYAAATEGISKAWISDISERSETATAIGFYTGFQSIATLLASVLMGLLWQVFGPAAAFGASAVAAVIVAGYVWRTVERG
jgi:MFS family permease